MSKKKRSKKGPWPLGRGKTQGNSAEASKAFAELETLPTFALVVTMNAINTALRQRGQAIRDWDQRDKVIQKFSRPRSGAMKLWIGCSAFSRRL